MSSNTSQNKSILLAIFLVLISSLVWLSLFVNKVSLEDQSRILDIASGFATLIALIAGGYWSYHIFIKKRISNPRLNVEYELVCIKLIDGKVLIKVFAILNNVGEIDIRLHSWVLRAERILPLPNKVRKAIGDHSIISERVPIWKAITKKTEEILSGDEFNKIIEPREIDRAIANIVVPSDIDVIQVYSHFKSNHPSQPLGWPMQTIVDLRLCEDQAFYGKEVTMPGSRIWFMKESDRDQEESLTIKQETERDTDRSDSEREDYQEEVRETNRDDD